MPKAEEAIRSYLCAVDRERSPSFSIGRLHGAGRFSSSSCCCSRRSHRNFASGLRPRSFAAARSVRHLPRHLATSPSQSNAGPNCRRSASCKALQCTKHMPICSRVFSQLSPLGWCIPTTSILPSRHIMSPQRHISQIFYCSSRR